MKKRGTFGRYGRKKMSYRTVQKRQMRRAFGFKK